jgi:hypothetical protein
MRCLVIGCLVEKFNLSGYMNRRGAQAKGSEVRCQKDPRSAFGEAR